METEITDIGKVAITPRKDYKNEQTYEWLDVVTYDGAGYMCIAEDGCTGIVPTNTDYWQLLADKGHFTEEDKEEFKKAVVEESKTEINEHTDNKKTELNNYTTELEKSLENELDTYKTEKEGQLDLYKATLETEMTNKKDSLIEEIETAQDGFDANVEEKTNTFNSNVETKTTEFNNNSNAKTEEFNNNFTEKINNFNSNAEEKIADYNEHVETLTSRITDLEEETNDLFNALDTEKASGTELYIEDAKPCRVINTEIGGMYKQNRTKGLNFFDITGYTDRTVNGINIKVNDDGTLTLNGVCTVEKTFVNISIPEHIIPAGTYTRYMSYAENIKSFLTLALSYNNTTIPNTSVQPNNQYTTSTYNDDITYNQIKLYIPNTNVNFNNIIVDPMLVRGEYTANNAPKYEPYTGGNPSPNPDYPQAIEQVESVKLNIRGKNLCDGINQNYYLTNNVDICGKVTGNSGLAIDVQDKSYVTISTKITQDRYRIACTNSLLQEEKATTVAYRGVQKDNTSATVTINTTGYKYLIINATDLSSILVENGSVATEYEPYQNQAINIDLKGNKLCAVPDTIKDKLLIDRNGNVALQKNVIKIDISNLNNNSWRLESNNTRLGVYSLNLNVKGNENQICNYFSNCNKYAVSQNSFAVAPDFVRIRNDKKFTTVEDFKNWLQKNNLYAYCEIKNTQLIDLGQIAELPKTFEGINNIWAETNLGNTKIEIEYVQDVKKLLEKQAEQQNARLDNIEALLSTTQTSALLLDNMQEDLEKEVE